MEVQDSLETSPTAESSSNGPYEVFMLVLCVYVLVALTVDALGTLDAGTRRILGYADSAICLVFFVDFLVSLARAPDRRRYFFTWGWLDLLSSIPLIEALRWGRVARVARIIRVFRGVRTTRILASFILQRRAEGAFLAAALLSILFLIFASIGILKLELGINENITDAEDALWWAFVTITTVGYGDTFPVTPEGRLLGSVLMVVGVGLFGTFTGFVASWFLSPGEQEQEAELEAIRRDLSEMRQLLAEIRAK